MNPKVLNMTVIGKIPKAAKVIVANFKDFNIYSIMLTLDFSFCFKYTSKKILIKTY